MSIGKHSGSVLICQSRTLPDLSIAIALGLLGLRQPGRARGRCIPSLQWNCNGLCDGKARFALEGKRNELRGRPVEEIARLVVLKELCHHLDQPSFGLPGVVQC